MAARNIIQERLNRLDTVPDQFNDRMRKAQREIYLRLLELLDSFERDGGVIVANANNLGRISALADQLERAVVGEDYLEALTEFIEEFDKQADLIFDYLASEFDLSDRALANSALLISKQRALDLFLGQSIKNPILNPIEGLITEAVMTGGSYVDLVRDLQAFTQGDDRILGLIHRYSKQISYDAFAVADRNFTRIAIQDLDVQFYRYQGGIIEDTRPFCNERNGEIFHWGEVEEWGALEWAGQYKGTNSANIWAYAGGYNCRHSFVPVSEINVPREVLERAMAKGFYNPSASTKKLLGL